MYVPNAVWNCLNFAIMYNYVCSAAIKHILIEYVQVTEQIDKRLRLSPFGFCNPCGTIGPSTLTAI